MSISKATLIRLPKIKAGLMEGQSYSEIGLDCGVTLKTIYRDVQVWTQTNDFDEWLDAEWLRLKTKAETEDFMEVFRQLTKLKAKRITQKIEARTETTLEIKQELTVKYDELPKEERDLCRKLARRYIKRNNQERPASIH